MHKFDQIIIDSKTRIKATCRPISLLIGGHGYGLLVSWFSSVLFVDTLVDVKVVELVVFWHWSVVAFSGSVVVELISVVLWVEVLILIVVALSVVKLIEVEAVDVKVFRVVVVLVARSVVVDTDSNFVVVSTSVLDVVGSVGTTGLQYPWAG